MPTANLLPLRMRRLVLIFALLLLPLLITYGSILGNHTISYGSLRGGGPTRGVNVLPVLDPSAGTHQDEPWSYYIGSSWLRGEIPLINQNNGLGAPLLSSLQSGALYPGNLLLLILPKHSSQFFDWFSVAHVALLALGLYLLAHKFTAESWLAAFIAGSFAASLATIYHINMVHFREFSWSPLIAVGLIDLIKRPGRTCRPAFVFAIATYCCFSAGNPQGAVLDFGAAFLIALCTIFRDDTWRRWWIVAAAGIFGMLLASTTMVPYLTGMVNGDLWSVADPNRSRLEIRPMMLLDMIIPRGTGYAGDIWHYGSGFFELQFAWPVTWLLGSIGWFYAFCRQPRLIWWSTPLICVFLCFLAKIVGLGPWSWISDVPILSGVRFTKYTFWTALILLPIVVAGLDAIQKRCLEQASGSLAFALSALFIFVAAISGYLLDYTWRPDFTSESVRLAASMVLASLTAIVALPWILTFRCRMILLLLWSVCLAWILRPAGFHRELPYAEMRLRAPPETVIAASLSDSNWDRGIHRTAPAFFVNDASKLLTLAPGDVLIFPGGKQRTILRLLGDQAWLDGPDLLDPATDGFPHPISVSAAAGRRYQDLASMFVAPWPRVVDANTTPNINLILGYSSPWVFDPIMNRRYRNIVTSMFQTFNAGFDTHPATNHQLSNAQIDTLRMFGVGLILGYPVANNIHYRSLGPTTHKTDRGLLPEAIVLPESAVASIEDLFRQQRYGDFVDRILQEGQICAVERPGPNGLTIQVPPGTGSRRLLVNRVYMSGWSSTTSNAPIADFWLGATVEESTQVINFHYWPPGLTLGLLLASIGLLGFFTVVIVDHNLARRCVKCTG